MPETTTIAEINRALAKEQSNGRTVRSNIRRGGNALDIVKQIRDMVEDLDQEETP